MTSNRWLNALIAAAVIGAAVYSLVKVNMVALPDHAVPIVWDREVCAHCSMHIGEPAFAAQLQLLDGTIHNFDDPGCLFELLAKDNPEVHAVYFRDYAGHEWLSQHQAAFIAVEPTPMGYGIAAVKRGTAGAQDMSWAKARVLEAKHAQREAP